MNVFRLLLLIALVGLQAATSHCAEVRNEDRSVAKAHDVKSVSDAIAAADLVVVAHFEQPRNNVHASAKIVYPMALYGKLETNRTIVANFSTRGDTVAVEPEAVWIFFLHKPYRTDANLEYREVVVTPDGFQGIVPGTQENIRLLKDILRERRAAEAEKKSRPMVRTVSELLAVLSSEATPKSEKLSLISELKQQGGKARDAIPVLTRLLDDKELALSSIGALLSLGVDAIPSVKVGLTNREELVRLAAAAGLGSFRTDAAKAVPALVSALEDRFEEVRIMAAVSLGKIRSEPSLAVPALVRKLDDDKAAVQQEAARALGAFGSDASSAVPALQRCAARGENPEAGNALRRIASGSAGGEQ